MRKRCYQFWWVRYYFPNPKKDQPGYEDKPMMLLHSNPDGSWTVAYMTHGRPKYFDPDYDVEIARYDLCGLKQPTYLRCNKTIIIPESCFLGYAGFPTIGDLDRIKSILGVATYPPVSSE